MKYGFAICLSFLFAVSAAQAVSPQWPANGEIVFDVLHGDDGMKLGVGTHRWSQDGRAYEMSTRLETTGLANVLFDFEYVQTVEGAVRADGLQPRRFVVEQKGRETEQASFDWQTGSVLIERRKNRKRTASVTAGDLDVLSVWHLGSVHGAAALPEALTLVSNRSADAATLQVMGMEEIALPAGRFKTQHVRLADEEGRLAIDLWLSQQHAWLPVRILMKDHKGQVLDQRASSIRLGAPLAGKAGR